MFNWLKNVVVWGKKMYAKYKDSPVVDKIKEEIEEKIKLPADKVNEKVKKEVKEKEVPADKVKEEVEEEVKKSFNLKGDASTEDARLDRVEMFDEKSREFPCSHHF